MVFERISWPQAFIRPDCCVWILWHASGGSFTAAGDDECTNLSALCWHVSKYGADHDHAVFVPCFFLPNCFRWWWRLSKLPNYSGRTSSLAPSLSMSLVIFSACLHVEASYSHSLRSSRFNLHCDKHRSYNPAWYSICTIQKYALLSLSWTLHVMTMGYFYNYDITMTTVHTSQHTRYPPSFWTKSGNVWKKNWRTGRQI